MVDKSNFTPAEWKVLLQSMIAAGTAVTAADPSGLWGLLKESFAGGTALAKAKRSKSKRTHQSSRWRFRYGRGERRAGRAKEEAQQRQAQRDQGQMYRDVAGGRSNSRC